MIVDGNNLIWRTSIVLVMFDIWNRTEVDTPDIEDTALPEDLPWWVAHIVVWTRVLSMGAVVMGVMYVLSVFTYLPVFPSMEFLAGPFLDWWVVFLVVTVIVMPVLFFPSVALSWLIAAIFYRPLREGLIEEWKNLKAKQND